MLRITPTILLLLLPIILLLIKPAHSLHHHLESQSPCMKECHDRCRSFGKKDVSKDAEWETIGQCFKNCMPECHGIYEPETMDRKELLKKVYGFDFEEHKRNRRDPDYQGPTLHAHQKKVDEYYAEKDRQWRLKNAQKAEL